MKRIIAKPWRHWKREVFAALLAWFVIAYFLLPRWWMHHELQHPALVNAPQLTHTGADIPGDPVNLSLIGPEPELVAAMLAAGWDAADPITLESSLRIAVSTIFRRPYVDAPVSHLFLFGRKEDLAFEKPVGHDASQRHHVRFWRAPEVDEQGRLCWFGSVTFDRSVGLSHTTGQITHHIAPDLDAERDALMADLQKANRLGEIIWMDDFQTSKEGRNGGGDPWKTDGRLPVMILR